MSELGWDVVLCSDDINSTHGVVYVLHEVRGIPPEGASQVVMDLAKRGEVIVAHTASQQEAEEMVAVLQLRGLHAGIREVKGGRFRHRFAGR